MQVGATLSPRDCSRTRRVLTSSTLGTGQRPASSVALSWLSERWGRGHADPGPVDRLDDRAAHPSLLFTNSGVRTRRRTTHVLRGHAPREFRAVPRKAA